MSETLSRVRLRALSPVAVPARPAPRAARWRATGPAGDPLISYLRRLPYPVSGTETDLLTLPERWPAGGVAELLDCYRAGDPGRALTVVHRGAGGGSLLRGLAAVDGRAVGTIAMPRPTPRALARVAGLLGTPTRGDELVVAADGTVSATGWAPTPIPVARPAFNGAPVLVTGGLGGLGSRLALALAAAGAVPVLADARPIDQAAADTRRLLDVLRRYCPRSRVMTVDLRDPVAAAAALGRVSPVAVVHCAGRIAGGTGRELGAEQIGDLVGAKVDTLVNTLDAVRPERLGAVLTFGSLTAHGAHPSLSGYALANELLRRATARFAAAHPGVRCCTAEWSLWSGAGMAQHVARLAARRLGMVPVPSAVGVATAVRLVGALLTARPPAVPPETLLLMGERFGTQGAWSGRPEGVPGVEAAMVVRDEADLARTMRAVAEVAAGGEALLDEPHTAYSVPLLVRATVDGDRVTCVVRPVGPMDTEPLHSRRYLMAL